MSGAMARRKGVRAEREVAELFDRAGFQVRGLESTGDHLCIRHGWKTLHVECKRQETIAIRKWCRQAEAEVPTDGIPLVVWRPSREPWRVTLPLSDFLEMFA